MNTKARDNKITFIFLTTSYFIFFLFVACWPNTGHNTTFPASNTFLSSLYKQNERAKRFFHAPLPRKEMVILIDEFMFRVPLEEQ
jgi:hypothetical protein